MELEGLVFQIMSWLATCLSMVSTVKVIPHMGSYAFHQLGLLCIPTRCPKVQVLKVD